MSASDQFPSEAEPRGFNISRVTSLSWILILLIGVAYSNSLTGGFVFDDEEDILNIPTVRTLSPWWTPMLHADHEKVGLSNRPLVSWTFGLNYAMGGHTNTFPYHLTNLLIHMGASLALLGLVRRTLLAPQFSLSPDQALNNAFAVAGLWAVHPLHTQAVTGIVQRYECMMGMFALCTMYCANRAITGKHPVLWSTATTLACLGALGSKEVAISIPLLVLLYDRTFYAGGFLPALKQRWGMYLGLVLAWAVFAIAYQFTLPKEWAGQAVQRHTCWEYFFTQPEILLHYIRLWFLPIGQCADYVWQVEHRLGWIVIPTALVALLGLFALWKIFQRTATGYIGAWFFILLGPTSSILVLNDLAFEHRMYLSAVSLAILTVWFARLLISRLSSQTVSDPLAIHPLPKAFLYMAIVALGVAAYQRNKVWKNPVVFWKDVVEKRPLNGRGSENYIKKLILAEQYETAYEYALKTYQQMPEDPYHNYFLGLALSRTNQPREAVQYLLKAVSGPHPDEVQLILGNCYRQFDPEKAIAAFQKALELNPKLGAAHNNLGILFVRFKKFDEADKHYRMAMALDPFLADTYTNYSLMKREQGDLKQAVNAAQYALKLQPNNRTYRTNYQLLVLELRQQLKSNPKEKSTPGPGNPDPAATQSPPGN